jgi:hypothetical protein
MRRTAYPFVSNIVKPATTSNTTPTSVKSTFRSLTKSAARRHGTTRVGAAATAKNINDMQMAAMINGRSELTCAPWVAGAGSTAILALSRPCLVVIVGTLGTAAGFGRTRCRRCGRCCGLALGFGVALTFTFGFARWTTARGTGAAGGVEVGFTRTVLCTTAGRVCTTGAVGASVERGVGGGGGGGGGFGAGFETGFGAGLGAGAGSGVGEGSGLGVVGGGATVVVGGGCGVVSVRAAAGAAPGRRAKAARMPSASETTSAATTSGFFEPLRCFTPSYPPAGPEQPV